MSALAYLVLTLLAAAFIYLLVRGGRSYFKLRWEKTDYLSREQPASRGGG